MKRLILIACFTFYCVAGNAVETNITILGVALPGANTTRANHLMQQISAYWPSPFTHTTITLANGGALVPLSSSTSGTDGEQLAAAEYAANSLKPAQRLPS